VSRTALKLSRANHKASPGKIANASAVYTYDTDHDIAPLRSRRVEYTLLVAGTKSGRNLSPADIRGVMPCVFALCVGLQAAGGLNAHALPFVLLFGLASPKEDTAGPVRRCTI
jgi:hypothetical protein